MPTIEIEVEVWCSCGEGLCSQSRTHRTGRGVEVEPCEKCLEQARKEGFDDGYEQGRADEERQVR